MTTPIKLSILDYSPVDEGLHASDALAATVRLAQHVEAKGFHRYWVSEHHGMPATASNAPEILMARIASACASAGARMGLHIVQPDPAELSRQIAAGSRFIAYGIDSVFLWRAAERPNSGE